MSDVRLIDMRSEMIDGGRGRYSRQASGHATIGLAWHHTAVMSQARFPTEADERNHVKMIDQYHHSRGWGGFGYNGIAFPSGRAYFCGDFDGARAHVASRNHQLDGICLAGLFVGREPTDAQLAGARLLRDLSIAAHGALPEAGHAAWALPGHETSCPGDNRGEKWIPKIATAGDDEPQEEEDGMAKPVYVRIAGRTEVYEVVHGARLQHMWPSQAAFGDIAEAAVELPSDHWIWKLPVTYHQVPGSLGGPS